MPKLASASGVSYGTMQTVFKNDLNLSPYKITEAQLLSQATKTKRLQRVKFLLENLRDSTQPSVLWTVEKLFTVTNILVAMNMHSGRLNITEKYLLATYRLWYIYIYI